MIKATEATVQWLHEHKFLPLNQARIDFVEKAVTAAIATGELDEATFIELQSQPKEGTKVKTTAEKMFSGSPNVKSEESKYSQKRWTGRHRKTGETVIGFDGREVESPSELDKAKLGALVKHLAIRGGVNAMMADHEKALLYQMASDDVWVGELSGQNVEVMDGGSGRIKALLDDNTSGGLEIAPVAIDEQIVTFPLLSGELAPYVDLQNLARGRRVEGASISNVTINSGAGDAVETPLFDTTSMVDAIDSTVYNCDCTIVVGLDFASDTIIDIGRVLGDLIGSAQAAWLDEQCAIGDGTTEPEGLLTASGITTINTNNGNPGPATLSDFYSLYFGIAKQYRRKEWQMSFLSNDTTYARSRANVRVDPHAIATTVNQTPLLSGVDSISSYTTVGERHAIQNNIGNRSCLFGALRKAYRLWRRAGLALKVETGGITLTRNNEMLIHARARYGGKVVCAPALCKWTDGQG